MKSTVAITLASAGILFVVLNTGCLAGEIPENVEINLQVSNPHLATTSKDMKKVPAFSHAKHATTLLNNNREHVGRDFDDQFTCTACHPGVEKTEDISAAATKEKQALEVNEAGGVKKYMHGLCLNCHKSMKKAALTTGPTSCKGCHNPQ